MNSTIVSYFLQFDGHKKFIVFLSEQLGFDAIALIAFVVFLVALIVVVKVMALVGGLGTYAERKISADIQMRQGLNRVGPFGLLQFLADGVKMIMKEDVLPKNADKLLFTIALLMAFVGVFGLLAVVLFSSGFILTDLNVGVFYLIGVSSLVGVAIFLGGYSSNSKWSMLGGMRGVSQIISYEVPVILSILAIVILAGGLFFNTLVNAQGGLLYQWYVFYNLFTFIGFFVFFIGAFAEINRVSFDLPEAESELVSGYYTEYTGMRFGFFALAEYIEVFVVCGVVVAAFLGGYKVPFDLGIGDFFVNTLYLSLVIGKNIGQILQVGSFVTKTLFFYYVVIWICWTFPRLRVDYFMTLCWKYLTPIALFNLVGCAVWLYAFDGYLIWELFSQMIAGSYSGGH